MTEDDLAKSDENLMIHLRTPMRLLSAWATSA